MRAAVALGALAAAALAGVVGAAPPAGRSPAERDAIAPASDDALTQLSRRLSSRLEQQLRDPCLANARAAVTVRDLATGAVLFVREGDTPLAAASNMKLITAAAVQELLGPEHELRTLLRADRTPDAAGDVGALYIVGGGDPSLDVEALHLIARSLASAGVRRVSAGVVADESYFAGPGRVASWPERYATAWYSAPCSALCCNFNVVSVCARGARPGVPARVWVDPFPSFFEVEGTVRTGRGAWSIRTEAQPVDVEPGGGQRFRVSGFVPAGRTARQLRAVESPALFCAHGLVESLQRVGVEVGGPVRLGAAPPVSALLHAHASKPLSLLVYDMNKVSSNVFAESLLRVLGAELLEPPGTREKGLAVLRAWLDGASPRASACRLEDGSGLSPEGRLTTNVLTDVLLGVSRDPFTYPEFLVSLPIGGVDGTLSRRLDTRGAQRLVRAKTGRLANAVALSGIARVADARDAVFSVVVNDYHCPTWKVQDQVDALVTALVAEATPAPLPRARLDLEALRRAPPAEEGLEHVEGEPLDGEPRSESRGD